MGKLLVVLVWAGLFPKLRTYGRLDEVEVPDTVPPGEVMPELVGDGIDAAATKG